MNKIKSDNFNKEKRNMSNTNISYDLNNNTLNGFHNNPSKKNLPEIIKIPKNIGPYEIISKLKDGCYSKIYLAKSKYTGDNVCIKIIEKITFQENVEDLLLATRQIETLKILKHRNILSLLEIYESPKFIFLITEYLSGKDLIEHLIIKKRFSEAEAQKIFFQLLDALYYMHKMNICHRDIRSDHIIFDNNNTPKIIGFSYSTFYNKNQKLKDSFGSICYACPEIIQENSYDPELADIWSLGVVLYTMVCGYLPFSEENDEKNKDLITKGKIDFPKEISNKLKDLIKHMLDINSSKRYNFIKIMKHPWFKPFNEDLLIGGCNLYKMIYPVDERILNIIKIFDLNSKKVENDMKNNRYNIGTGLFRHLVIKLNGMGFKSISDLGSKEFLQYKNNINNYYQDDEKRFNNYLNHVQEKIEKIEKCISDYQEKEENIILSLNNLEELNLSKNKNINDADINGDINSNQYLSDNNSDEYKNNNNNKNSKTNIKTCHRRTLTPMFAFQDFESNELNSSKKINNFDTQNLDKEIGHINKNEMEIINKSKKSEKNAVININNELKFNIKVKKLFHSKSCPHDKSIVIKLFNNIKNSNKNKNSKNNDVTRRIDDTHNITASYTKWQDTSMVIRRKKNYLNSSSFIDGYLKRTHPDNLRKNDVKNSLLNDINQIIIEENNNNNSNNEIRRSKQIRYSLSFGDDDEDEDDINESSYISKIDSKQVSIYDIDEELKVLKEIGTTKSPNVKTNSNNYHGSNNNIGNRFVSNFNEKYLNLHNSNKNNTNNNLRNNNKHKSLKFNNSNKENPIIFNNNNQAEMSFHNNDINNNNINNNINENQSKISSNNNISSGMVRSNSTNESNNNNNKINNYYLINKNEDNKYDNNPIYRANTYVLRKKEENKEINIFRVDKKKISKLNINNNSEGFSYIDYIIKKANNKYLYSYLKDVTPIKKINIFENNCLISISDMEKIRSNKENKMKKKGKEKEKEKEKDKDKDKEKDKFFNRNSNGKILQKKTFEMNKTKKDKNVVIIENNNTTRKYGNGHNSKDLLSCNGYSKNNNLKNPTFYKNNNNNNNDITEKKTKKKELKEINNCFKEINNNMISGIDKGSNKKLNKSIKFQNNIDIKKNKEKNKQTKKYEKSKKKSDLSSNKLHEELNFTNISDISEIKTLSIVSPGYINNNINPEPDNKYQNIYDNKENILFSNNASSKLNYLSLDKSFQSQYQYQNKSKYQMSNLSVSHENNIICKGIYKGNEEKEKNNDSIMNYYYNNNFLNKKNKTIINNSNSNIYLEDFSMNSNLYNNNYDNFSHRMSNENKNYNNIDYINKNSYNNNYIVTIKKRNLAEKLKEEIQKSINKNNFNSPSLITNGRVNTNNDNNIEYKLNKSFNNGGLVQSNGKKIREKFMRCSSLLNRNNNIVDNNPISKNSNILVNNYNNNIPIRHYDLNRSQYVTQYININNTNTNISKNININNSINAINNQTTTESYFGNLKNIKRKDNSTDTLLNALHIDNKIEENECTKRKATIKIKKKLSNSITYESADRNNSASHIICVSKSKKKSNGKKKHSTNNNLNNNTITININNNKRNNLLKNLKYKCINGNKTKNFNLNDNNNVIILSKHKKNYDYNNFPEKNFSNISCSVPDLYNCINNNNNINSEIKKQHKISSDYIMPKNNSNTNNNILINKKTSFNKNNESNYNKFKKKNSIKKNMNFFDLNNNNNDKNKNTNKKKSSYKKSNNITHRINMHLLLDNQSKIINTKVNNKEQDNNNNNNKFGKNNPVNISSYKKVRKTTDRSYKKNIFL